MLRGLLSLFDSTGSGFVSVKDFEHALITLIDTDGSLALSRAQAAALAKALDKAGDGRIPYSDFIRSFKVGFADHSADFVQAMAAS